MLSKKSRINKELFQEIMKKGFLTQSSFFVFRYVPQKSDIYKIACVAPKSVAKRAVLRNKMRRRVYLIVNTTPLSHGYGIFFYKKLGVLASTVEIRKDIFSLLKKANFI